MMTLEKNGEKYIKVPDWTSAAATHDINYAYLKELPPSELLWFLDNIVALLKEKIIKLEAPLDHANRL